MDRNEPLWVRLLERIVDEPGLLTQVCFAAFAFFVVAVLAGLAVMLVVREVKLRGGRVRMK